jgi:hypothetical protein
MADSMVPPQCQTTFQFVQFALIPVAEPALHLLFFQGGGVPGKMELPW